MTSENGTQKVKINVLPDISKSKDNQTMKFGQLKEYSMKNIFFQKSCRNYVARILVSDLFLFFKRALYEEKAP